MHVCITDLDLVQTLSADCNKQSDHDDVPTAAHHCHQMVTTVTNI